MARNKMKMQGNESKVKGTWKGNTRTNGRKQQQISFKKEENIGT